jgi:hypothetical protein
MVTLERKPMKRGPGKVAKANKKGLDAATPALLERSGGMCEARIPGCCTGKATDRHHRTKVRSDNRLANLMHLCTNCHTASPKAIHRNVDWAREHGFLLKRTENPEERGWSSFRRVK